MQWFDRRMAGWYRKGSAPKDERVEGGNGSSPEWRDGTEKGRSLKMRGSKEAKCDLRNEQQREKREESRERREKREESREG